MNVKGTLRTANSGALMFLAHISVFVIVAIPYRGMGKLVKVDLCICHGIFIANN